MTQIQDSNLAAIARWKTEDADRFVTLTSTRSATGERIWACEMWDPAIATIPIAWGASRYPSGAVRTAIVVLAYPRIEAIG